MVTTGTPICCNPHTLQHPHTATPPHRDSPTPQLPHNATPENKTFTIFFLERKLPLLVLIQLLMSVLLMMLLLMHTFDTQRLFALNFTATSFLVSLLYSSPASLSICLFMLKGTSDYDGVFVLVTYLYLASSSVVCSLDLPVTSFFASPLCSYMLMRNFDCPFAVSTSCSSVRDDDLFIQGHFV